MAEPKSEVYYTAEDMAHKHQYTVETIWRRCRMYEQGEKGGWPHRRDGRSIRFSKQDVEAIDQLMNPTPGKSAPKRKRRSLAI